MERRLLEESFGLPPIQDEEITIDPNPELDNVKRFAEAHKALVDMNDRQAKFIEGADKFVMAAIEYNKRSREDLQGEGRTVEIPQIENLL